MAIILGNNRNNRLNGTADADLIRGLEGSDTALPGLGDDTIEGGPGLDFVDYAALAAAVFVDFRAGFAQAQGRDTLDNVEGVFGTAFDDTVYGSDERNEILVGNGGDDFFDAGQGKDTLIGGLGDDTMNGRGGVDTADYRDSATAVTVDLGAGTATGEGSDVLISVEVVFGSTGRDSLLGGAENDYLIGWDAADTIDGAAGNDTVVGSQGNDLLTGGAGVDNVEYRTATGAVSVDLGAGTATGTAGTDTLSGFECVVGGNFADSIAGGAGNEWLVGGNGDDTLRGGAGQDSLVGGGGTDTFEMRAGAGVEIVNDFQPTIDRIVIRSTGYGGIPTFVQQGATDCAAFFDNGDVLYIVGQTAIAPGDITVIA